MNTSTMGAPISLLGSQIQVADRPPASFLLAWHALALALLLLLPYSRFHVPFWHLTEDQRTPLALLAAGFTASALLSVVIRPQGRRIGFLNLIATILAVFGIVFLGLLIRGGDSSRQVMLLALALALVLIPTGLYLRRMRAPAIAILALATAGALAMNLMPTSLLPGAGKPKTLSAVIPTGFYNLHVVSYQNYIPAPAVRGGGIARIGQQFLLATGDGYMYLFGWNNRSDAIEVRPLPYRIPANGEEFAADNTGGPWRTPLATDDLKFSGEDAGSTVIAWWFRVTGILTQENGDHLRVFAAHDYWKRAEKCWVERVSLLEGTREDFLRGAAKNWRTVFETTPCLPIQGEGARSGTPFCGHFGGGRMVMLDADTVLLSVGDFGFNGAASKRMLAQDTSATYGKTVAIHVSSGASEIYSLGNRNPQGLYRDPNGVIWDTEHGPRGGDELNIIRQGTNYGWPIVTYGTDYGTFTWPLNPKQGEHEGFEAPFYAWLPSIGVSNLIGVEKDLFPIWHGDLLVTSLVGKSVYRLRIRENRVAYAEPIILGERIRDISEGRDGRIVLWADDDNTLISLQPTVGSSGEILFAANCGGCHKLGDGTSHRIGPDLWGILSRKVASADGYRDYSAALRAHGGSWTEQGISDFIKNPQAAVPGTAMEYAGLPDADSRSKIIDYIKHAPRIESR
jgi:cytochrome c2